MHNGLMLEIEEATNRTVERVHVFPRLSPPAETEKSEA
jgi:hypothetical protein